MIKLFISVFLAFAVYSCSSKPSRTPRVPNLALHGVVYPLSPSMALNEVDGKEIWYSSFAIVPPMQATDLILRRKTLSLCKLLVKQLPGKIVHYSKISKSNSFGFLPST
jgi:hypothetical protein